MPMIPTDTPANNALPKKRSLRGYLIKVQLLVALVVVLSYSLLLHWFFIEGLDTSNFLNMSLEVNTFSQSYNRGENPEVPRSIHFSGYIGWQNLPAWAQQEFPDLKIITEMQMRDQAKTAGDDFFGPPEEMIFIIASPLDNEHNYYLIRRISEDIYTQQNTERLENALQMTWPLALFFLLFSQLSVYLIMRKLTAPLEQLGDWSDALTLKDIGQRPHDFGFDELNRLAAQQQAAFNRIGEVLEKEQDFLQLASHELRTPITVIKSNAELLERVLQVEQMAKGENSVARIRRAVLNMQQLTETLLWLSRDEDKRPEESVLDDSAAINLTDVIEQLVEDSAYLLQGKAVDVRLELLQSVPIMAETPCRLVLSNLIRNAFQYTAEGDVVIHTNAGQVIIENHNHSAEDTDPTGADYGYGLGLKLVERITRKMRWFYSNQEVTGGRRVTVRFSLKAEQTAAYDQSG